MKRIVRYIAIAFSFLYVIFIGILIALVVKEKLDLYAFLGFALSTGISLILLWALDNALARIERLENILSTKDLITDRDLELEKFGYVEESPEVISECKNCGYQLFPEDKVCPNCNTHRDDTNNNK